MGGGSNDDGSDCSEYICSNDKDEKQLKQIFSKSPVSTGGSGYSADYVERPLNAIELGRSTWPLLHRFSLRFPENPTDEQKAKAVKFIESFSKVYPCKICRTDFQITIKEYPPKLDNREQFAIWLCEQHNMVNQKLGKPQFKCNIRRLELMYNSPVLQKSSQII